MEHRHASTEMGGQLSLDASDGSRIAAGKTGLWRPRSVGTPGRSRTLREFFSRPNAQSFLDYPPAEERPLSRIVDSQQHLGMADAQQVLGNEALQFRIERE